MPNFKSVAQIVSEIWKINYFRSHLGIQDSAPWGPKFTDFVFVIQGTSVPKFKSVAQIVSEIWKMKYFGGHLGIEDSAPWGPKFINFVLLYKEHLYKISSLLLK